jgi:hypothetical protein
MLRKLFCKHKNLNRIWEFFPNDVFVGKSKIHGLKIKVCMDCQKIIEITDYAK